MNSKEKPLGSDDLIILDDFKKKSDIHWARKIWHICGVLIIFVLFQFLPQNTSKYLAFFGTIVFIALDLIRNRSAQINAVAVHLFKPIMRQSEVHSLAGTTYLFSGVCILILFFDPLVVSLSLLFLAFADPFASYFGIRFGKDKIYGEKTIQGFLAAFFICTMVSIIFLNFYHFPIYRIIIVSILGGLLGALAELIPLAKLDDNLTIPIVSGVGLTGFFYFFEFL